MFASRRRLFGEAKRPHEGAADEADIKRRRVDDGEADGMDPEEGDVEDGLEQEFVDDEAACDEEDMVKEENAVDGDGEGLEVDPYGCVGKVNFETQEGAEQAVDELNGSLIKDATGASVPIAVGLAEEGDGTQVIVEGLPRDLKWQELKDHFKRVAPVKYANVLPPTTREGEVRFDKAEDCLRALDELHGVEFKGSPLALELDPKRRDQTKLLIRGIPAGAAWKELKDHFLEIGSVAFAEVKPEVPLPQNANAKRAGVPLARQMPQVAHAAPMAPVPHMMRAVPAATTQAAQGFAAGWQAALAAMGGAPMMGMDPSAVMQPRAQPAARAGNLRGGLPIFPQGATSGRAPSSSSNMRPGTLDLVGEVKFARAADASNAMRRVHTFAGVRCTATPDRSSKDGTKVLIMGVPSSVGLDEFISHFAQFGQVTSSDLRAPPPGMNAGGARAATAQRAMPGQGVANVVRGVAGRSAPAPVARVAQVAQQGGGGKIAEVRFQGEGASAAVAACVSKFNGTRMGDRQVRVEKDLDSSDGSKVRVYNLSPSFTWQLLKDTLKVCGPIAYVGVK